MAQLDLEKLVLKRFEQYRNNMKEISILEHRIARAKNVATLAHDGLTECNSTDSIITNLKKQIDKLRRENLDLDLALDCMEPSLRNFLKLRYIESEKITDVQDALLMSKSGLMRMRRKAIPELAKLLHTMTDEAL